MQQGHSHRHNPIGPLITEILAEFFPDDPPQFYQVPFSYHQIDPIKDSLGAAGFTDLRIAVLSLSKIIPDVPTYARALVLGNPLIDQYEHVAASTQNGLLSSLLTHYLANSAPIRRVSLSK